MSEERRNTSMKNIKHTGMKKKTEISPREATTTSKLCSLKRDNISTKNYWILLSENNVSICMQSPGNKSEGMVKISRAAFNKFIDWYNKKQLCTVLVEK